jgi:hypothetical protein
VFQLDLELEGEAFGGFVADVVFEDLDVGAGACSSW